MASISHRLVLKMAQLIIYEVSRNSLIYELTDQRVLMKDILIAIVQVYKNW